MNREIEKMNETKFTPGPWMLEGHWDIEGKSLGGWLTFGTQDMAHYPIFEMIPLTGSNETIIADATLISAAPDLYAALVEAKREMWVGARDAWTMADFKNWAVIQQIDAALSKARGTNA